MSVFKKEVDLINQADRVESQTARGAYQVEDASGSGLISIDETKPEVVKAIESTGKKFQERLLTNSSDPFNKSVDLFAKRCHALFTQKGPDFQFSVLLLTEDPLHYASKISEGVTQQSASKKYFGVARPIFHQGAYTLQVQVIGARVSEMMKEDIQGLSLASAVASRKIVESITRKGIGGDCTGEVITGMSDLNHLGKVLPVIDEISSNVNRGIVQAVYSARGSTVDNIADLGHTHNIATQQAKGLSQTLVNRSTTLNPLMGDSHGTDRIIIDPQLTDNLTVIPMWDELRGEVQLNQTEALHAGLASVAVGVLSTFGKDGVDELTEKVIIPANEGKHVGLSALRTIRRMT